jgi:hypothetical protein
MQAAQSPLSRPRDIVLHEVEPQTGFPIADRLKGLGEVTARIAEDLGLDDD